MARTSLPPGFRFHPTDEELVLYYLKRKVMGKKFRLEAIAEVNIYRFSPWDLPDKSCLKSKDLEWFFFCPREKKYASGARVKRATENGYWKTTGRDRFVYHNDKKVGTVKTLIFHLGHAPQGERTDWVLHEYRILDSQLAAAGVQDTYVLCKIFKKNGAGPKNGAQYGAPFDEAEWADDNIDDDPKQDISFASDDPPTTLFPIEDHQSSPLEATGLLARENTSGFSLIEGPSVSFANPAGGSANETNDEIVELLASFTDDSMLLCHDYGGCQDDLDGKGTTSLSCLEEYDIYNGLGDLDSLSMMENDASYLENNCFLGSLAFIELDDLLPSLDSSIGFIDNVQPSSREIFRSNGYESVKHSVPENQLAEGTYAVDNHPFRLGKGTGSLYQGVTEAAYDLGFALGRSDNGTVLDQDIRRGSCADN